MSTNTSPVTLATADAATTVAELRSKIERLEQENERLRTADVATSDPRVRHIWIEAARTAQQADFCNEYDRIALAIGGLTRDDLRDSGEFDEEYEVTTQVTFQFQITISACDEQQAIQRVDDMSEDDLVRQLTEGGSNIEVDPMDLIEWDAKEIYC